MKLSINVHNYFLICCSVFSRKNSAVNVFSSKAVCSARKLQANMKTLAGWKLFPFAEEANITIKNLHLPLFSVSMFLCPLLQSEGTQERHHQEEPEIQVFTRPRTVWFAAHSTSCDEYGLATRPNHCRKRPRHVSSNLHLSSHAKLFSHFKRFL